MTPNNHASQDRGGEMPESVLERIKNEAEYRFEPPTGSWPYAKSVAETLRSGYIEGRKDEYLRHLSTPPSSASSQGSMEWIDVDDDLPNGGAPADFDGEYFLRWRTCDTWGKIAAFYDWSAKRFYTVEHDARMEYMSTKEFPGLQWLRELPSISPSTKSEK